ncbi:MAG: hypothetical protein ACXQS8_08590 [Candidatus Helarchaeales archaeon]
MMNVSVLNEKSIRACIKSASEFYSKQDLDRDLMIVAIDLIVRYLKRIAPARPRDLEVLYAAAYHVASRHPFSHPNSQTKEKIAVKFGIKLSSLSWYVQRLLEDLEFIRLYDEQGRPYYIDPQGLISAVLHSITSKCLNEHLIKTVINNGYPDVFTVQERVVATLIENLRIIPEVFRRDLQFYIHDIIKDQIALFEQ